VCCGVLQSVAACRSVSQRDIRNGIQATLGADISQEKEVACCSVLRCVAVCCRVLQCCSVLQCVAVWCSVLQSVVT